MRLFHSTTLALSLLFLSGCPSVQTSFWRCPAPAQVQVRIGPNAVDELCRTAESIQGPARHWTREDWSYEQGPLVDGQRHGDWLMSHPTGRTAGTGRYSYDWRVEQWTHRAPAGYVQETGERRCDRREGNWRSYHANGRKATEGAYHLGEKVGLWRSWDDDGTLLQEEHFTGGPPNLSRGYCGDRASRLIEPTPGAGLKLSGEGCNDSAARAYVQPFLAAWDVCLGGLSGFVAVRWSVTEGRARDVQLARSTLSDPEAEGCLLNVVKTTAVPLEFRCDLEYVVAAPGQD